jgi:single-strand DNA-binding protein
MFDTTVTIVGNALNAPELRRTSGTNTLVASFRVASTSRRYDKDSGRWVDGPSLRVRVTCWRRLAEGVNRSVVTGDPLVVTGRMYTRDWIGDDGQHRVSYELEAIAVGHDLSRGYSTFTRHRPAATTTMVEDDESDARVAGEASVPVTTPGAFRPAGLSPERPTGPSPERPRDDGAFLVPEGPAPTFDPPPMTDSYGDFDPAGPQSEDAEAAEEDAMNVLRAAGLAGASAAGVDAAEPAPIATQSASAGRPDEVEPASGVGPDTAGPEQAARPGPRRNRMRVPAPA